MESRALYVARLRTSTVWFFQRGDNILIEIGTCGNTKMHSRLIGIKEFASIIRSVLNESGVVVVRHPSTNVTIPI